MVQGISGRVKRYVSVTVRVDEDGRNRPLSIQWYDGRTYAIDELEFTPISLTPSTPPKRPPAHASPRTPRG